MSSCDAETKVWDLCVYTSLSFDNVHVAANGVRKFQIEYSILNKVETNDAQVRAIVTAKRHRPINKLMIWTMHCRVSRVERMDSCFQNRMKVSRMRANCQLY